MPVIRVLKPFMFSFPARAGEKLTSETKFLPGEHDVPQAVIDHPWIKAGADGKIETLQQAAARTKAEADKAALAKEDADRSNAMAQAAVARLKAAEPGATGTAEEIAKELDTPVNEIQGKRAGVQAGELTDPSGGKGKK
jgi:hypothetical protein